MEDNTDLFGGLIAPVNAAPPSANAITMVQARKAVCWQWVRGHSGHGGNERADQLATRGMTEAASAAGKWLR